MSDALSGKTITAVSKKNLNLDEIVDLVRVTFQKTGCNTCTSGGHFVLRQETELTISPNAQVTIT
jgi:hypothetical protein